LLASAVALPLAVRPRLFVPGTRALDGALIAALAVAVGQLVPVSAAVRWLLSPAQDQAIRALRLDGDAAAAAAGPLSLDPDAGLQALLLAAAVVAVFWCARSILVHGGLRRTTRVVAICGLVAAAIAIAQHATAPHRLYWI